MGKASVIISLVSLVGVPGFLAASDLYQFAMYHSGAMVKEECALVQRYSPGSKESARFPGQLSVKGCEVTFPHQLYEDRFQFCFLSGFNLYKINNPEMIECVIQKRDDKYMFLASIGEPDENKEKQVMCYFTCVGGERK